MLLFCFLKFEPIKFFLVINFKQKNPNLWVEMFFVWYFEEFFQQQKKNKTKEKIKQDTYAKDYGEKY